MRKAFNWVTSSGSTVVLRITFLIVGAYLALSTFGFEWAPFDIRELVGLNVAVLWLFLELALTRLSGEANIGRVLPWDEVAQLMRRELRNGAKIDIVGSSTSSYYLALFQTLRDQSDIEMRIVMRSARPGDQQWIDRLNMYGSYWNQLANCHVEIKYTSESTLRMMKVNDTIAIGAYVWDPVAQRYFGHTVPMLFSKANSEENTLFEGIFDHLWREASSEPDGMREISETRNRSR